ncbi:MAG: ABC transporter substrate-binding protein, partial [Actinomycetota bacterium]|nr:ABC transporter substrate-binding protein [Actinomycetota bacterium]
GMRRLLLLAFAVFLAAAAPAAAQRPVVYSSLPLQGEYAAQTRDVVRGIRLALERAGSPVRYVSLDDSTRQAGTWTPEAASANARRAASDRRAIAYIGEFNSGATAISLPILNEAGILQVSPSNTAIGLTVDGPGTEPGEPDYYYPTGVRTYGRVIPNDRVQGAAGAVMMRDAGMKRVLFVHDGSVYGRGMARLTMEAARARGIEVLALRRLRPRLALPLARRIRREVRRRDADGVYFGGTGVMGGGGRPLWRTLGAVRGLRLFGPDGMALPFFLRRLSPGLQRRTQLTLLPMPPSEYPAAGQEVFSALGPGTDAYALYGYEAMSAVLDAFARGGPTRQGVRDAFFATRDRDSVLGRYSIDAAGDTSLTRYGVYGVRGGRLVWDHAVDTAAP